MDAVMFLKEKLRMCKTVRVINFDEGKTESCENCPITSYCGEETLNPEKAVSAVEKWSEENPIKTNGRKFQEVFGWLPTFSDGEIYEEWWNEPYKEPEGR